MLFFYKYLYYFVFCVVDTENEESQSENESEQQHSAPVQVRGRPINSRTGRDRARRSDSANGWTATDQVPTIDVFTGQSGITDITELDENSSITDFFCYFIDNEFLHHIKEQTNLYARQCIRKMRSTNSLSPKSRMANWKGVTISELRKFFGIIFHTSVSQKPHISDHWSKKAVISCNFCPNLMSRDRFLLILRNFHINDNSSEKKKGEPGYDPLHKIRPLVDKVRLRFQQAYQPAEDITIDEGMCKYRGRIFFKQYMPQKPNKYGIKLYMLSESDSGYIWNFSIFCGQSNVVTNIVKHLLGDLLGKGHTLFTDGYYTCLLYTSRCV